MQKILHGKRYNTDSATWKAMYSYGNPSDFNAFSEVLYQKKTGEFFLHGFGGPMSRYAKQLAYNSFGSGDEIIPLTEEGAREWCEKYCDFETYVDIFGNVPG